MLTFKRRDSSSFRYSPGLQVLRGLAALMIVFLHLAVAEGRYGASDRVQYLEGFRVGAAGVDIFFVISGFVMMMVIISRSTLPSIFLKNRLTRIYPNYWIYFFLVLVVWFIQPGWVNSSMTGTLDFVNSFLLLPASGVPVVSVAWTLEFEIYFYLVFTLFLWVSQQYLGPLVITVFTILVLLGGYFQPTGLILDRLTDPLLLEFCAGVLLGQVLLSRPITGTWLAIPAALLLFILNQAGYALGDLVAVGEHFERLVNYGVPAALLVFGIVSLDMNYEIPYPALFIKVGDASYTLYLSHILVISAMGKIWQAMGLNAFLSNAIFISIMMTACLLFALLAYKHVEKPLLQSTRKLFSKQSK